MASAGGANQPEWMRLSVNAMFTASADDRGTVQALARELDEAQADGKVYSGLVKHWLTCPRRWYNLLVWRAL